MCRSTFLKVLMLMPVLLPMVLLLSILCCRVQANHVLPEVAMLMFLLPILCCRVRANHVLPEVAIMMFLLPILCCRARANHVLPKDSVLPGASKSRLLLPMFLLLQTCVVGCEQITCCPSSLC